MVDGIFIKRFVADLTRLTSHADTLIEKDVWQKLVLNRLYSNAEAQTNLVFKGGTCITRTLLGYYRFSEDLDFAWITKKNRNFYKTFSETHLKPLTSIGVGLGKHYGTQSSHLMKWDLNCDTGKLVLSVNFAQEIVFTIQNRPIQNLKVDETEKQKLLALHPLVALDYFRPLKIPCYSPEEIASEKLVAILTRRDLTKPRDIVDLFHMQRLVDLPGLVSNKTAMNKMERQVNRTPGYARIFRERKDDIQGYLMRLVEESERENALYIKPLGREELEGFSTRTLVPALKRVSEKIED